MAPHHVIQATSSEGLAQGPYVSAIWIEPATFCTEGTENHQSATTPHNQCHYNYREAEGVGLEAGVNRFWNEAILKEDANAGVNHFWNKDLIWLHL